MRFESGRLTPVGEDVAAGKKALELLLASTSQEPWGFEFVDEGAAAGSAKGKARTPFAAAKAAVDPDFTPEFKKAE